MDTIYEDKSLDGKGFSATQVREERVDGVRYGVSHGSSAGRPITLVSAHVDEPTLVLTGHVLAKGSIFHAYWTKLLEIGGATALRVTIRALAREAYNDGYSAAQEKMRIALGIE